MKKEVKVLNTLNSFEGLASSLIGLFVPVYLLSIGHSLRNVFLYYLLYSLMIFIGFFASAFIASKTNLKILFLLRYLAWLIYFLILFFLNANDYLIYGLAVSSAACVSLYYFPYHIILGRETKAKLIGETVSLFSVTAQTVGLLAPFISALIIKFFGFRSLFAVALFITATSLFFMKQMPELNVNVKFSWPRWLQYLRNNKTYFWYEFLENIVEEIDGIVWPIFVYITFQSIWSVASVSLLASLGSIILTWIMRHSLNGKSKLRVMIFSVMLLAGLWLSRFWVNSAWIYVSSIIFGLISTIYGIAFNAMIYIRAKKTSYDEFIVFREAPIFLARTFVYLLAIILFAHLKVFFALAVIVYFILFALLKIQGRFGKIV